MKTIKNILFKLDIKGNGIVNFDSSSQKYIHNTAKSPLYYRHDNISYSKKNFYGTAGEDNFRYEIKITPECMKKSIFGENIIAQTSKIAHNDELLYAYLASPTAITRGYLDTTRKEEVYNRNTSLKLHSAKQVCDAVPYIETFSKSGYKKKNNGDSDKSDNTFYKKESVGDIRYESGGLIDLKELQFISCDQVYGRYSFNPDKFDLYKMNYELRFPESNLELDYYQLITSSIDIPEYGIKLGEYEMKLMVKGLLLKLLGMEINRSSAYAHTAELKIKLVENSLVDTKDSEDNWITISSEADIENLDFNIHEYYELASENTLDNRKKMMEEFVEYTK
tara:strand:- start:1932 stop:2939 length:1008 start_codon:yes stop_codon:yes gene_type:complete